MTPTSTEGNYQPGDEWELAWADEFESGTINPDNWNYQVEKAGQFNDEWQRYTNSSENASSAVAGSSARGGKPSS